MKKTQSIIIAVVLVTMMILVGCSNQNDTVSNDKNRPIKGSVDAGQNPNVEPITPAEQQVCKVDSDCVPIPTCHPRACINKDFESKYKKPDMCTELFDCSAAYVASDCICTQGRCMNVNLDNKGCKELNTNKNLE